MSHNSPAKQDRKQTEFVSLLELDGGPEQSG